MSIAHGGQSEADPPAPAAAAKRRPHKPFDRPRFLLAFLTTVYVLLFAPIVVVVVFSFNAERSLQVLNGFGLHWYRLFLSDTNLISSTLASIKIALGTTVIATVLGTMLALALVRARSRALAPANTLMLLPLVTPEIVTATAALLLFTQLGIGLSLVTVTMAHITFSISYVTVIVRARLSALNPEAEEAALDLGATELQTLRLVTLPALRPAILAAGMLVFVMSFDDFVTSYFTSGNGVSPLPVAIYSMIRYSVTPEINAIGTLMMAVTLTTVTIAMLVVARSNRHPAESP